MQTNCRWQMGMKFLTEVDGRAGQVEMDAAAPFGRGVNLTPKELLLAGLSGCTGMDVIGLLRKHKQDVVAFEVLARATESTHGHPVVFSRVDLLFRAHGEIEPPILIEAVRRSQSEFCGVSAMLSQAFPVLYKVELNDRVIGTGKADFSRATKLTEATLTEIPEKKKELPTQLGVE